MLLNSLCSSTAAGIVIKLRFEPHIRAIKSFYGFVFAFVFSDNGWSGDWVWLLSRVHSSCRTMSLDYLDFLLLLSCIARLYWSVLDKGHGGNLRQYRAFLLVGTFMFSSHVRKMLLMYYLENEEEKHLIKNAKRRLQLQSTPLLDQDANLVWLLKNLCEFSL